jgi:hypothetical protein
LNKQGDVINIIPILVTVLGLAIILPIAYLIVTSVDSGFQSVDIFNQSNTSKQIMADTIQGVLNFDMAVVIIWVGLMLVSGIFAFFIRTSPIFFPLNVFLLFIVMIISIPIQFTWETLKTVSPFDTAVFRFPMTDFIMSNAAYWTFVYGILLMILMFAVTSNEVR